MLHNVPVTVQRIQINHLRSGELEVQNVQILGDPLQLLRLRNERVELGAVPLNVPSKHDLSERLLVLRRHRLDGFVPQQLLHGLLAPERRVGGDSDLVVDTVGDELLLLVEQVHFDLVDVGPYVAVVEQVAQERGRVVADPDLTR